MSLGIWKLCDWVFGGEICIIYHKFSNNVNNDKMLAGISTIRDALLCLLHIYYLGNIGL